MYRRPFGECEWLDLCCRYEGWARREEAESRHLRKAMAKLGTALRQRRDRAERVVSQSAEGSARLLRSEARLAVLRELENILRIALEHEA